MSERRRQEIAEKRQRLAQLKQARQDREEQTRQHLSTLSNTSPTPSSPKVRGRGSIDEIDQLLRGVGVSTSTPSTPRINQPEPSATTPTSEQSLPRPTSSATDESIPPPPPPAASIEVPPSSPSPPPLPPQPTEPTTPAPPVPTPKPKVVYDKSIQTSFDLFPYPSTSTSTHSRSVGNGLEEEGEEQGGAGRETAEELRIRIVAELEQERLQLDREIAEERRLATIELERTIERGLSPVELEQVLTSSTFGEFLDDSTRIVQRALSEGYDYLRDYTIVDNEGDEGGEGGRGKQRVKLVGSWRDDKWGKGRSVTGLDWSPKFPELFVASYNKNPMALNEPDGIACVWNLHLRERPEFVFHAQSDILSISFSPFHPNLVIGGTYSGQILLWDTRSRHPNPVLKTPLSASGHTHPVYSLSLVGTQNAHSLVSASTDGTVCGWTLDMLARPQETLQLVHPAHTKTDEVSTTCLGFPSAGGETTTFWVGTEEGNLYRSNRYDRAGSKAGLVQTEVYKGHSGPVTGIDFHPVEGKIDLSDLFLTSGVDWTVRLWRARLNSTTTTATTDSDNSSLLSKPSPSLNGGSSLTNPSSTTTTIGGGGGTNVTTTASASHPSIISPLMSFEEADDYVYDVKWHPHHPAVFASVDGNGRFDLWNLNVDTEVPIISTLVGPDHNNNGRRAGLNKLAWDRKEGKKCAVGSSDGTVYVYEVSSDLITPREGEWEQMRRTCNNALQSSNGF